MPDYKKSILEILAAEYPNPGSELNFKNEYQLLVAVLLSAQCTDKKVNHVTPELFKAFPDFKKLAAAKPAVLRKLIKPINYYITKSKHLIETARILCAKNNGKVPRTPEGLTELPGVGRKTANVVLGEMGVMPTFPVDTHVMRVSKRLGFSSGINPVKTEEELKLQFEPESWRNMHHWLILHGRRVCKAQNPNCADCKLNKLCPSAFKAGTGKKTSKKNL